MVVAGIYEIIRQIGSGGGGNVFLANHLRLNKQVVLKADKRRISTRPEQLRREVDILKELNHPSIPSVYDFFEENGTVYTVMDFVEGESLDKPLKRGQTFTQAQVIAWAKQLLDALSYLHSPTHGNPPRGFVHSDIKPANLMLRPDGTVCLIDFNIALALGEEDAIGRSAGYASPEHYGLDFSTSHTYMGDGSTGLTGAEATANSAAARRNDDKGDGYGLGNGGGSGKSAADAAWDGDKTVPMDAVSAAGYPGGDATELMSTDAGGTGTTELMSGNTMNTGNIGNAVNPGNIGHSGNIGNAGNFVASGNTADATELMSSAAGNTGHGMPSMAGGSAAPSLRDNRSQSGSATGRRRIVPDVRSDIYSTGATFYHLLSGVRPARNAMEVEALPAGKFSRPLIDIISRAMQPNPDLRYQSAEDMLYDLTHIRDRDPRVKRLKLFRNICVCLLTPLAVAGVAASFIGLKRMQTTEEWLKMAEYSETALKKGDVDGAIEYALAALPDESGILVPEHTAEAQKALTDALGVYDYKDGFRENGSITLPSAPLFMAMSPGGGTAAVVYDGNLAVIDMEEGDIRHTFPVYDSALSEAEYAGENILVYAGVDGITACDADTGDVLWTGEPATAVAVSADGNVAAGVLKDAGEALLYDISTGECTGKVNFGGKHQSVTVNDDFANPMDSLFELNHDGSRLAASFSDGSLDIFDVKNSDNDILLYTDEAGAIYTHFGGGFSGKYFAYEACGGSLDPEFAVIDCDECVYLGGFSMASAFGAEACEDDILLQNSSVLVSIDPEDFTQTPLVNTDKDISSFAHAGEYTAIVTENGLEFYDSYATLISSLSRPDGDALMAFSGDRAVVGDRDTPLIRLIGYEEHSDETVLKYPSDYVHDEARLGADGETVMLFSYEGFRIYGMDGTLKAEVKLPDADKIYDQQYVRDGENSYLEVTYNDGSVTIYDASTGDIAGNRQGDTPDGTFDEEFTTSKYRITSPLHGTPAVYDIRTGKQVRELKADSYLTYVTEQGNYIVAQYVTADGTTYGELLDSDCKTIAELPYLCDVTDEKLVFDYPGGRLCESRIYGLDELKAMAREKGG